MQSVMLVFLTQLCELLPLSPSLWFNSPPLPSPFLVWISILYTCIQCVRGGGYGILGLRQINTCRKVPLHVHFCRWRHFALPSLSLVFLRPPTPSRQFPYKKLFVILIVKTRDLQVTHIKTLLRQNRCELLCFWRAAEVKNIFVNPLSPGQQKTSLCRRACNVCK
jgi:hypothetical protein